MHITDEELLASDDSTLPHLTDCVHCQKRVRILRALRTNLATKTAQQAPPALWKNIDAEIKARNEQSLHSSNNYLFKKGLHKIAIAASMILSIALIVFLSPSENTKFDHALNHIIEQNHLIQSQLDSVIVRNDAKKVRVDKIQAQLLLMDNEIQRAYVENYSSEELIALWETRHRLLQVHLTQLKHLPLIRV